MENALKFCKMGRGEGGKEGGDRATVVLRARSSTEAEWGGAGRWEMPRCPLSMGLRSTCVRGSGEDRSDEAPKAKRPEKLSPPLFPSAHQVGMIHRTAVLILPHCLLCCCASRPGTAPLRILRFSKRGRDRGGGQRPGHRGGRPAVHLRPRLQREAAAAVRDPGHGPGPGNRKGHHPVLRR